MITKGFKVYLAPAPQQVQQLVFSQDSDAKFLLTFFDDQANPIDVTAATAISISALQSDGLTVLSKGLGTGIALVPGTNNQALVSMLAADLALLPQGDVDVEVKISLGGVNYAFNLYGGLYIEPPAS